MAITTRKPRRSAVRSGSTQPHRQREDAALLLIKGLAYLIAQAQMVELAPAIRILTAAKEDLVYWAAEHSDVTHTPDEVFIDRHLFASGLFPAAGLALRCQAVRDAKQRKLIAALLGLANSF